MSEFFKKRRKHHEDDGEWSLTFADMMTLLLCFFILIVAVSTVDPAKFAKVTDSLEDTMRRTPPKVSVKQKALKAHVATTTYDLQRIKKDLEKLLKGEKEVVRLRLRPDAVSISLQGAYFFNSGSASLTKPACQLLAKIAGPLKKAGYPVIVEGHSDNVPMHSDKFPSNWELSSARACAVTRFLIEDGFPRKKLKVMGLADTQPLAPNKDIWENPIPENQALNRRVVLLVKPDMEKKKKSEQIGETE